jgi:hypothetical protein
MHRPQVNLCHQVLLWDPDRHTSITTALNLALFNGSRAYQSLSTANMILYATPADIAFYMYASLAMRPGFPLGEYVLGSGCGFG